MDFANHPGQLFVVATLLPLASFLFLLVCFAIRSALRSSKEGTAGAVLPPPSQAVQDHTPIGIGIEELAFDATKGVPPFLSTRGRCSRLIALTIRCRMR